VFGYMFVRSRRVNRTTVVGTGFNFIAFVGGAGMALTTPGINSVVLALVVLGTVAILAVTAGFVAVEKRKRSCVDLTSYYV